MFWFLKRKKEINKIKEEIKNSFEKVKEDFVKVGEWITHFDVNNKAIKKDIEEIKSKIQELEEGIKELGGAFLIGGSGLFKHKQTAVYKQTNAVDVQTAVQTAVQTGILDRLTPSERAILLALLYSDMKLSYEDLSFMLGKDKSTIRGQINAIKRKSESLIQEITEENGKKRVFVPEEVAKILLKNVKVRVRKNKKEEEKES